MVPSDSTTEGSENYSSEESEKMVHSQTTAPSQARTPIPPSPPSGSESDDDSDSSTSPPITHQQQEKKKEQQPQPRSPSPSDLISNKTAATKTSRKRLREEEENDGTPELPSTKKKPTASTAQHSDEVPAKEKKKAPKQNVAESVSTPPSPQKSGKKALQVWSTKEELAFLNGLLAFKKEAKEFPKNMSPVYDYVRNMMDMQYSNKQFSDKLRRLKAKFQTLVENMGANNYSFKSTDEAAMYKTCKQLWGGEDEGDDGDDEYRRISETAGKASTNGKETAGKAKKKKRPVQAKEEDGEDQGKEEEEGQDGPKRNKTMVNALVKSNGGHVERIDRDLYSQIQEKKDDMMNEMKNTVAKILEESQAKKSAMIEGYLLNSKADHVQLPYSDLMNGILSGRRAPVFSRVKAEALEEKWRKQQIVEVKAFLGRLDLLKEECEMCLEELGEPVGSDSS